MAFEFSDFLTHFEAGEPAHVADIELAAMETALVHRYLPLYAEYQQPAHILQCETVWNSRDRLIDLLRGKHFNGRLIDPIITKQPDAQASLIAFGKGRMLGSDPAEATTNVIGINISSIIRSSRGDASGEIARPVWYVRAKVGSNAYSSHRFWRRVVGDNFGENTIEDSFSRSKRSSVGGSSSRQGKRTSTRRVSNK